MFNGLHHDARKNGSINQPVTITPIPGIDQMFCHFTVDQDKSVGFDTSTGDWIVVENVEDGLDTRGNYEESYADFFKSANGDNVVRRAMTQPDVLHLYKGATIQTVFGHAVVKCLQQDDIVEALTSGNIKLYLNKDSFTQYFDSAATQAILKNAIENDGTKFVTRMNKSLMRRSSHTYTVSM